MEFAIASIGFIEAGTIALVPTGIFYFAKSRKRETYRLAFIASFTVVIGSAITAFVGLALAFATFKL